MEFLDSLGRLCVASAVFLLCWIDSVVGQVCREFRANWGFVCGVVVLIPWRRSLEIVLFLACGGCG